MIIIITKNIIITMMKAKSLIPIVSDKRIVSLIEACRIGDNNWAIEILESERNIDNEIDDDTKPLSPWQGARDIEIVLTHIYNNKMEYVALKMIEYVDINNLEKINLVMAC